MIRAAASSLHICVLAKEDLNHTKDAKFSAGVQVSCPYLQCNFKNSQFNEKGRFPSGIYCLFIVKLLIKTAIQIFSLSIDVLNHMVFAEFLLNHLHSNHKHRRFNGDNLDLTMVVPQVTSSLLVCKHILVLPK